MVTFDPYAIKYELMNSIRTFVYPQQTNYSDSMSVLTEGTIVQPLYLFSESISAYGVYVSDTIGSPAGLTIALINGASTVYSSTVDGTIGWNIINYNAENLVSTRDSSIVVTGDVSAGNDYYIGKDSTSTYLFSGNNTFALAFTIGVQDFVYKSYPASEISNNRFPIIAIDIVGRPKIEDKYLNSGSGAWFYTMIRADIYSKYTQELDRLAHAIDRGIFRNSRSFGALGYLTPGIISEITYVRPEVYTRSIKWIARKLYSRE